MACNVMKMNKILQAYDKRILTGRTKVTALEERYDRRLNAQILKEVH